MEEEKINWLDKAIEHEATPVPLREMTTTKFLEKYSVPESTYYYQTRKKENQEKIFEIALTFAKRHTPEVLENLGERAKKDNKATELFLNYVLKLAENLNVNGNLTLNKILDECENRQPNNEQGLEDKTPIQDNKQEGEVGSIQAEPSTGGAGQEQA